MTNIKANSREPGTENSSAEKHQGAKTSHSADGCTGATENYSVANHHWAPLVAGTKDCTSRDPELAKGEMLKGPSDTNCNST